MLFILNLALVCFLFWCCTSFVGWFRQFAWQDWDLGRQVLEDGVPDGGARFDSPGVESWWPALSNLHCSASVARRQWVHNYLLVQVFSLFRWCSVRLKIIVFLAESRCGTTAVACCTSTAFPLLTSCGRRHGSLYQKEHLKNLTFHRRRWKVFSHRNRKVSPNICLLKIN